MSSELRRANNAQYQAGFRRRRQDYINALEAEVEQLIGRLENMAEQCAYEQNKVKQLEQRQQILEQIVHSMQTPMHLQSPPRLHELLQAPTVPSQKHIRRSSRSSIFYHPSAARAIESPPSFGPEHIGRRIAYYNLDGVCIDECV